MNTINSIINLNYKMENKSETKSVYIGELSDDTKIIEIKEKTCKIFNKIISEKEIKIIFNAKSCENNKKLSDLSKTFLKDGNLNRLLVRILPKKDDTNDRLTKIQNIWDEIPVPKVTSYSK